MSRTCNYCNRLFDISDSIFFRHKADCHFTHRKREFIQSVYDYGWSVCLQLNIPTRLDLDHHNVVYDGQTIGFLHPKIYLENILELERCIELSLHEVAHWLYASSDERTDRFFKLGPSDFSREEKVLLIDKKLQDKTPIDILLKFINSIKENENVSRRYINSNS